jgi:hypothetical protein
MWTVGFRVHSALRGALTCTLAAAKLTREREGSWVEERKDANGPASGNGGRDGLGREKRRLFRGGVVSWA